jgi:hypothetical protein
MHVDPLTGLTSLDGCRLGELLFGATDPSRVAKVGYTHATVTTHRPVMPIWTCGGCNTLGG